MSKRYLERQRKSRNNLSRAVAKYVNLRAGDSFYDDTVHTTDRNGRQVVVFVKLDIISDEMENE